MPTQPTMPLAEGTELEVCWGNYISTVDNKTKVKMWCPCKVVRTADGATDKGRDGQPLSSLARKLAPAGRDLNKLAAAMDENWREVYELAELVAERHMRSGESGAFCEPVTERLMPAATTFDHDWKAKV